MNCITYSINHNSFENREILREKCARLLSKIRRSSRLTEQTRFYVPTHPCSSYLLSLNAHRSSCVLLKNYSNKFNPSIFPVSRGWTKYDITGDRIILLRITFTIDYSAIFFSILFRLFSIFYSNNLWISKREMRIVINRKFEFEITKFIILFNNFISSLLIHLSIISNR